MSTRKETIIVELGGDSKKLLKELNLTKQAANQWGRDIAKEITTGRIPDAWKSYTQNVKDALNQTDAAGKSTAQSLEKSLAGAATKIMGAFLGFNAIKKTFNEINQSMQEVTDNIEKFGQKASVSGFLAQKQQKLYGRISENDQMEIAGAQAQKTGLFEGLKIQAAKFGALATTSAFTYAGMLKGKSFDESFNDVRGNQKQIWAEMKALKLQEDGAKLIEKQVEDEKERVRLKVEYINLVKAEHEAWRKDAKLKEQVAVGRRTMEATQSSAHDANFQERLNLAGDNNYEAASDAMFGNPTAQEDWAARVANASASWSQRVAAATAPRKGIREQIKERRAAHPRLSTQDVMNRLSALIKDDAVAVKVKLDQ